MKKLIRTDHLLVLAALAVLAVWPLAQVAHAGPPAPTVPSTLQPPAGNKVFLVGHAVGVQIYSCNVTASGFAWGFVAPRADLYGDNGKLVATHFGGPTWQARDGSFVVAQRAADPVTVDSTAIPWLLLSPVSKGAGPDGDRLAHTTYIQRIGDHGRTRARRRRSATRAPWAPWRRSRTRPTTTSGRRPEADARPMMHPQCREAAARLDRAAAMRLARYMARAGR